MQQNPEKLKLFLIHFGNWNIFAMSQNVKRNINMNKKIS